MTMEENKIKLFEDQPIRTAWDEENEEWYFSVVDVVRVLTDQPDIDGEYSCPRKPRFQCIGNRCS